MPVKGENASVCARIDCVGVLASTTAVVKKVVGTHYFLAIFGPIGAHFSPQPLRQPHGMTVSHIVKVNHTVIEKELEYG